MISPGMLISERYEIIDKVGSGGMADVYNSKDLRLNRNVAIKVLKREYSNDAKFVAKFRAEAQSVAGLSHPNIVNVYDVGEDENLHYIVMELVEGITLKKFIEKKGRLELNEAIGIGIQIAQGIDEAHKNHIIHRDIKPQNIIISKEGKVKVTDFGIAKAATSNTITSNAMGSVHYISPEQARGGYSDEKSDIYSLGVTIYEMLLGKVPFEGESTVSVAYAHVHEEAPHLNDLDPSIPLSLSRIVQKCMQKKPDFRYENAGALIMDLRRAVSEPDGAYVELETEIDDASRTIVISDDVVRAVKEQPKRVVPPAAQRDEIPDDEEPLDEEALDPKLERILKICSGVVAVIIVVVILLIVGKVAGWWGGSKNPDDNKPVVSASPNPSADEVEMVIVPDLLDRTLEEAQKMLEEKNLEYRLEPIEDSEKEVNLVTNQEPAAGEEIEEGSTVTLYYVKEPSAVVIPNLENYTVEAAQAKLEELGLTFNGTSKAYSDSVEANKVCGTEPVEGTSVSKGSSVRIIISRGPETEKVKMPNLLNKTVEVALEILADAGLVGNDTNITYKYSNKYAKGKIMGQSVKTGKKVELGTVIDFTVSLGPETAAAAPTTAPTATPNYRYVGTKTISVNPFEYEDEDPAEIKLILTQDNKSKTVFTGTLSYSDFPKKFTVYGWSESTGTLAISKDGVIIDGSYDIEFEKVAE